MYSLIVDLINSSYLPVIIIIFNGFSFCASKIIRINIGIPLNRCKTFGIDEFILLPSPAAIIATIKLFIFIQLILFLSKINSTYLIFFNNSIISDVLWSASSIITLQECKCNVLILSIICSLSI